MSPFNFLISSLLLLLTVNALLVDVIIFSRLSTWESTASQVQVAAPQQCSAVCQRLISEEIAKNKNVLPTISAENAPVWIVPSGAKEYFIPLGSGSTKTNEYEELKSVEAYVDTGNYPVIKEAYFDLHLRNPTGNGRVYAKLYNVTDKHDVWFSEVFFEGGGTMQKESKITLDPGKKLYRVMIKSSLRYDVYADNAKIRIVTQ